MTIFAIIRTQFEGIHSYPEASGNEVYLRYPHRHMFHVEVKIEQFHNNRDIEYIEFKHWLNNLIQLKGLNYKSCEMIAEELVEHTRFRHPNRDIYVKVFEDNENGAEVSSCKSEIKDMPHNVEGTL